MTQPLDAAWLARHPLPDPHDSSDKNERGRVLVVGGSRTVPGGLRLTGEAALRAGAGKVRFATVLDAAMPLGVLVPEAAMTSLPTNSDGEIAPEAAELLLDKAGSCDTMVLGPAMSECTDGERLLERILATTEDLPTIVLDAGALTCARNLAPQLAACSGRVIMTPHYGEMARLSGAPIEQVAADPAKFARETASRFGAVVLLKGKESHLAGPDDLLLHFTGGSIGLATGGSGDVLAGIIGGLSGRGATPVVATAWGCWLHARAGEVLGETVGTIGFLARELLPVIPRLLDEGPR